MVEITAGVEVRFRRRSKGRWQPGVISGTADGGAAYWVRDGCSGASRCLRPEQIEVSDRGPHGGRVWVSAAEPAEPKRWIQGLLSELPIA